MTTKYLIAETNDDDGKVSIVLFTNEEDCPDVKVFKKSLDALGSTCWVEQTHIKHCPTCIFETPETIDNKIVYWNTSNRVVLGPGPRVRIEVSEANPLGGVQWVRYTHDKHVQPVEERLLSLFRVIERGTI